MYKIRPYNDDDFDSVKSLLKLTNLFIPEIDTREIYLQKTRDDPATMLVAENGGEVVGFVLVSYDIWVTTIRHLCSHPKKGKGAGFYLGRDMIKMARNRGCKMVCSYTEAANERSVKLQKMARFKVWEGSDGNPMNIYCLYKKLIRGCDE